MHVKATGNTDPSFALQLQATTIESVQVQELSEKKKQHFLIQMSNQGGDAGGSGNGGGAQQLSPGTLLSGIRDQQEQHLQQQQLLQSLLKRQNEGGAVATGEQAPAAKKQRAGGDEKAAERESHPPSRSAGVHGQALTHNHNTPTVHTHNQHSFAPNTFHNEHQVRAELEARLLQQEMTSNRNAALLASLLGQPHGQTHTVPYLSSLPHHFPFQGYASGAPGNPSVDNFHAGLVGRNQSIHGMTSNALSHQQIQPLVHMLAGAPVDVNAMLRHLSWPSAALASSQHLDRMPFALPGSTAIHDVSHAIATNSLRLPPCDEGLVPHYSERERFPLGVDEDPNWLSEFHCFVRSELVEICRASRDDCKSRNNATTYLQVGVRCRFCAHRPPTARGCRSSAYPSSYVSTEKNMNDCTIDLESMCLTLLFFLYLENTIVPARFISHLL
jgi:hypothetical protein